MTDAARLSLNWGITTAEAADLLALASEAEVQAALERVRRRGVLDAAGEARKELVWAKRTEAV